VFRVLLVVGIVLFPIAARGDELPPAAEASPGARPARGTTRDAIFRVLLLRDANVRWVLAATVPLGVAAGLAGTFMLLRKQSLLGDVVSHAALPGVALAHLVLEAAWPGHGRWLPGLLAGALATGLAGALLTLGIRRATRIKDDAALAIVLSTFFGLGIVLLSIVQQVPSGEQAGLNRFIYGMAAAALPEDALLNAGVAVGVIVLVALCFKELALLCFDEQFARAAGWPATLLDGLLMALAVVVCLAGLQSVGLLLVVALLIIPPAAARFWTDRLGVMAIVAALLGGISTYAGVFLSATVPRLAAGAVIVLASAVLFAVSLCFGPRRGLVPRWWIRRSTARRVGRDDLLRAVYECLEARGREAALAGPAGSSTDAARHTGRAAATRGWMPQGARSAVALRGSVGLQELRAQRHWTAGRLHRLLRRAVRQGLLEPCGAETYRLTPRGAELAQRAVRTHRLWEMYLVTHADTAVQHVDRHADRIEHVLDADLLSELEQQVAEVGSQTAVPRSLHPLPPPPGD
jgi:manganese/zinc/iron transport system permease protein